MERVDQAMAHRHRTQRFNYEELVKQILSDPDVAAFIQEAQLTQAEIQRSISKFNQYISERNRFLLKDEAYIAKGYKPILVKNEGYADVSYEETPELKLAQKQAAIDARLQFINLPLSLKEARFQDIDVDDENRFELLKLLDQFVSAYPKEYQGYYFYGDFGVGKSYMMAALARELSVKHSVSTTLIHYPTFVLDIKHAINDGLVKEKVDQIKEVQILVLDDIGAEQSSAWTRDEILQVILQYRMQEQLPTFFTSNFNFAELEHHFAVSRNGDESWQAKRVMERIKYLAKEIHVKGENRRHDH